MSKLWSEYKLLLSLLLIGLLIGALACMLNGCGRNEPIRIGFAEQLTGPQAELGVQTRNGVLLAVEKINSSGGINGRPIKLIIRDDKGTPEGVRVADRELIKSGVVAIIGHATSQQTKDALPVIDTAHVVLISPSAAASELSTMSDYFFRVISEIKSRASGFAESIYKRRRLERIAVIYDTDNEAYALPYRESFASEYESLGGKIVGSVAFSSKTKPDFDPMLLKLRSSNADGLLIIASSYDTALIAQRTRLIGWNVPLFSSSWAEEILIKLGGKAVNGLELEQYYNLNSKSPAFQSFKSQYQKRYGEEPIGVAALGYETAEVLAAALKKTGGSADGLRQALLETKINGLVDTISFDKHGGVVRPFYVGVAKNGRTVPVGDEQPTGSRGK